MELTFEKVTGKKQWRKQSFVIIGAPKIGKSELFSVGDGSLFLDIEGGLSHLEVMKHPKDRPFLDWDELEQYIDTLVAMKQKGTFPEKIDTLVWDTATRLVNLATAKTVEIFRNKLPNKSFETIEEIPLGGDKGNPGWGVRTNLVDNLLSKAKQLGVAQVIIGHLDFKPVKNDQGVDITRQTISVGGNLGRAFLNNADHVLNIIGKNEAGIITRTVRALGTATIEAGSRGLCVPDAWVMVNPTARTPEALKVAALANYTKLRSFFE